MIIVLLYMMGVLFVSIALLISVIQANKRFEKIELRLSLIENKKLRKLHNTFTKATEEYFKR